MKGGEDTEIILKGGGAIAYPIVNKIKFFTYFLPTKC